jgi:hypothetical protein
VVVHQHQPDAHGAIGPCCGAADPGIPASRPMRADFIALRVRASRNIGSVFSGLRAVIVLLRRIRERL